VKHTVKSCVPHPLKSTADIFCVPHPSPAYQSYDKNLLFFSLSNFITSPSEITKFLHQILLTMCSHHTPQFVSENPLMALSFAMKNFILRPVQGQWRKREERRERERERERERARESERRAHTYTEAHAHGNARTQKHTQMRARTRNMRSPTLIADGHVAAQA